jgi:hypothetical protein
MVRAWKALLLALLAISGCRRADSQDMGRPGPADVVLDIFSGRPNPKWQMPPADTEALVEMIAGLPAIEPVSVPEPLGYRGLSVWWTSAEGDGRVHLKAFQGVVIEYSGDETRYYSDPARRVEHWLLDRGRPHLEEATYQGVLQDLSRTEPRN